MAFINTKTFEIVNLDSRESWNRKDIDYFEVDEMIAYPVSELNKKGYETIFCCSGHIHSEINELVLGEEDKEENIPIVNCIGYVKRTYCFVKTEQSSCYILFKDKPDFKNLPAGFVLVKGDNLNYPNSWCIEREFLSKVDTLDRMLEICECAKTLYEWVKTL